MTNTDWQHHINAWQRSNQSKQSYCHEHGLSYSRFLYWSNRRIKPISELTPPNTQLLPVTVANNEPVVDCLGVLEFPNGSKLHIHSTELLSSLSKLLST